MTARTPLTRVIAGGAVVLSVALVLAPLYPVYSTAEFWAVVVTSTLLGTLIAAAGRRWRLGALGVTALAVFAYFAFGGAVVLHSVSIFGAVPTLGTLQGLALGAVHVWKDMLTVPTPATDGESLLLAPYILGLLGGTVAASVVLRSKRAAWTAVPLAVLFLASIAFSTYTAFVPAVVGALFAVALVAWALAGRRANAAENLARGQATGHRALAAVGMLALAGIAGAGAGAVAPLPADRSVLRDSMVPPLDVHDLPSPLVSFRAFTTGGDALKLFTVSGLPAGDSIRLATLDQYDGIVYRAGGNGSGGAGQFVRVGRALPHAAEGATATLRVTVEKLTGVWMPDAGYLDALTTTGGVSADRRAGLNYNSGTGTAVLLSGLQEGDQYTAQAVLPNAPTDAELASASIAPVSMPAPQNVPEIVSTLASQFSEGATTPLAQLRAIEAKLHSAGFFSHGLQGEAPSRAGHTAERISALLGASQMVGDDEQYAVAMALMARQLGIPARVVMGFRPDRPAPGTVTITGADVHAWVEVPFARLGWVPFNPTPPKDQVPKQEVPQHRQKPQPQVQQPPPPVVPPVELPPAPPANQAPDGTMPADLGFLWAALRWTGTGLGVAALLLAPAVAVAVAKARRRRIRRGAARRADRISGGWSELVDLLVDHGARLPAGATRGEAAVLAGQHFPEHEVGPLAVRADRAVFGVGDPTEAEIAEYWTDVATAARGIRGSVSWPARLRARFFSLSVRRDLRESFGRTPLRRLVGSLRGKG